MTRRFRAVVAGLTLIDARALLLPPPPPSPLPPPPLTVGWTDDGSTPSRDQAERWKAEDIECVRDDRRKSQNRRRHSDDDKNNETATTTAGKGRTARLPFQLKAIRMYLM